MQTLTANSLKLSQDHWREATTLLCDLIKTYPVYGSLGLEDAQKLILSFMKSKGWTQVFEDRFFAESIKDDPQYVDVASFGSLYVDYEKVPKNNVIGIIEGHLPGPALLLNGHVDVDFAASPNAWKHPEGWKLGEVKEGKVLGRGASDMLSGLVALLTVANICHENRSKWRGRIIVTSVVDEEIGGNGTLRSLHWLKERGLLDNPVECLIAEPSDRKICTSSLGFLHLLFNFKKTPVHMGVADRSNNAIWEFCDFIKQFDEILLEAARSLDANIDRKTLRSNMGIIQGGLDAAIPIPEISSEGTVFFPETIDPYRLGLAIQEVVKRRYPFVKVRAGNFSFNGADYEQKNLYRCLMETKPDNFEESDDLFPSPCDARLFKRYQIPTVVYGPGFLQQAHAVDEFIALSEFKNYIEHVLEGVSSYLAYR